MTLPVHCAEPQYFDRRNTVFVGYRSASWAHIHSLEWGEIVLSRPTQQPLSSSDYRNCLGIAGQSPTGHNVLAHICPWTLRKDGFSSVFLRQNAEKIREILWEWREVGWLTDNAQLGIFGSCVFLWQWQQGSSSYLDATRVIYELLKKNFSGTPQILTMPQMGIREQHAVIADTGFTLYQKQPKIVFPKQTHFTLEEVKKRLLMITS